MWKYLRLHEAFVADVLAGKFGEASLGELKAFHDRQIAFMQHERLIHLIVTMSVAILMLLTLGFAVCVPEWPPMLMALLLLGLTGAYIVHYFRMENGVQRFYNLANNIDRRLNVVSATYEQGRVEAWRGQSR